MACPVQFAHAQCRSSQIHDQFAGTDLSSMSTGILRLLRTSAYNSLIFVRLKDLARILPESQVIIFPVFFSDADNRTQGNHRGGLNIPVTDMVLLRTRFVFGFLMTSSTVRN